MVFKILQKNIAKDDLEINIGNTIFEDMMFENVTFENVIFENVTFENVIF